jgi:immunity protein, SdpI family
MTKRRYYLLAGAIVVATLVLTAIVFPQLPAQVPTHWNAHNQIDRYGSKWQLVFLMPSIMVGMMALMAALPWLSPRHFEVDGPRPFYLAIMVILVAFLAYFQVLMILAALSQPANMSRAIFGGVCLLVAALGFVLPRLPRNFYIGVRTPWTLADERVWRATHRFAGIVMVAGGVLAFLLVMAQSGIWPPAAVLGTVALAPVIHSLVFYKQLDRHGQV